MPLLDSSDFTGGSVAHDSSARTYTITGGVREINDALTAPPGGWPGYRIICRSSGGLRFIRGAAGTMGEGVAPVVIIEESTAHNFGADNYNSSSGTGNDARFAGAPVGGETNSMVFDNVRWEIDSSGGRTDFDIARGNSSYDGPAITFKGVEVIISGSNACFNHQASKNWKCEPSDYRPFGLRVTNYTNNAAWEFSSPIDTAPTGTMVFIDTDPQNTANAHVAIQPGAIPANGVFQLIGLSCRRLAVVSGGSQNSTKTVRLIDPVGDIPRAAWSNEYNCVFEIVRTQPFAFSLAGNASGTLYCEAQDTGGRDATAAISSAGVARPQLLTQRSAHGSGTWTAVRNFRFHAAGFGFAKYYSGNTNIAIETSPATRNVMLSPLALPDGTALSSKTSGAIETAADLVNALHSYEVSNPSYPSLSTRLLSIANGVVQINTAQIVLSTSASDFIARSSNTITIQCDIGGIDASNGVTLLNAGTSYNVPSGTKNLIGFPLRDSTGTSALLNITAPVSQVYAYTSGGVQLGNQSLSSAGTASFLIPASSTGAGTAVGCGRAGRPPQSRSIDTSAGGTFNVEFADLPAEIDALGNALYDSAADKSGISVAFTTSSNPGRCTIGIPDRAVGVKQIYRALHDQFSNPLGGRFVAFGRQNIGILDIGGAIPNALFLGADCQLRRASSSGGNAAVSAFVLGGTGGSRVNEDRGPVGTGASITSGPGGMVDLTEVNAKLDQTIEALEHVATSLPIVFPEGSPLSPLVVICGLAGQSIIRDVESRGYSITPTGVDLDTDARGVMTFTGTDSHIDLSLARTVNGVTTNHTTEIITLLQCRPTAFNATDAQPLFSIGAALVSIAPSSGTTAALRIGVAGAQDTTELLTLNSWNTIAVSFQQREDAANYPIIRVSINGGAQQKWNDGSNELFAQIASSTTNFRIGARSTGGNTSVGFIGDARALWVHPNNAIFDNGAGWEIPAGIYWSPLHQLYLGAHLADRVEGVLSDIFEPIITDIDDKTSEIPQNTAAAVMSRSLGQAANANGNFGQRFRWLVENANTTTPPTAAAIATEVADELTIPTAAQNADAVWDETLSDHSTDGSAGKRLAETSTHSAPADSPTAQDVAEAVRDLPLSGATTDGSLGKKIADQVNPPTAAAIRDEINSQVIFGGVSRLQKEQRELTRDQGTFAIENGRIAFTPHNSSGPSIAADLSETARGASTITEGS